MSKIMLAIDALTNGGAERVTVWLADRFAEDGYEVFLLVHSRGAEEYRVSDQVKVVYLDDIMSTFKMSLLRKLSKFHCITDYISREDFDAVISLSMPEFNCYITAACKLTGTFLILSERNNPVTYPSGRILRQARNICYYLCNIVVFQTKGSKEYFGRRIQKKGVIIDNPLSDHLPAPYTGERENKVVTFSRLVPQKNLKMLIDAFMIFHKEHPQYALEIYGNGALKEELQRYIIDLSLQSAASIHPFTTNVHDRVIKSMMFVLSSDYEGVSNAMLESLAIGLPCICTDCPPGGARQFIVNGENGILVQTGDIVGLADAMAEVADNAELRNHMSRNGSKIRARLDRDTIYLKWKALIRDEEEGKSQP